MMGWLTASLQITVGIGNEVRDGNADLSTLVRALCDKNVCGRH